IEMLVGPIEAALHGHGAVAERHAAEDVIADKADIAGELARVRGASRRQQGQCCKTQSLHLGTSSFARGLADLVKEALSEAARETKSRAERRPPRGSILGGLLWRTRMVAGSYATI